MGGDEFLAIVRVEHISEVKRTLAKMAGLQKKNKEKLPIPLEAAYGIAYRHELLEDDLNTNGKPLVATEKVYNKADERMYAMKAQMKSKLVRR